MHDPFRTKLNLILTAALAFALGAGMASALDLTPLSLAAGGDAPKLKFVEGGLEEVDVSRGFSPIVERIAPGVVTIGVEQPASRARVRERPSLPSPFDNFFEDFFDRQRLPDEPPPQRGTASGFFISSDGYIVTNNHVVEGADRITVRLHDGREFRNVELVGTDPTTDVALLKINARNLTAAPLGYSDSSRVGDWVLAIGSPGFGQGTGSTLPGTVTAGIVSAKGRNIGILGQRFIQETGQLVNPAIEDFIQTDAVINPGNSGGPLVNGQGQVIGVNTAIFSTTGRYMGYGFAVPIELVRHVVDDLIRHGEVRRAVIGVTVSEVDSYDAQYYGLDRVAGVKVNDVGLGGGRESPAIRAGLAPGDIILAVNGRPVESVGDLQRRLRAHQPGETVTLDVVKRSSRNRERVRVTLVAAEPPGPARGQRSAAAAPADALGLEVQPLTAELRRQLDLPSDVEGVVVNDVSARSPLYGQVGPGMVITDVNGRKIRSPSDYREVAAGLEPGEVANLLLYNPDPRVRRYSVVTVPVSER